MEVIDPSRALSHWHLTIPSRRKHQVVATERLYTIEMARSTLRSLDGKPPRQVSELKSHRIDIHFKS